MVMAGTYLGLYLNDSDLLLQMFLNMKIQLTKNVRLCEYTPVILGISIAPVGIFAQYP